MPFISPRSPATPRPRSEMRRRRRRFGAAIRRRIWHHSGEALHTEDRGSISSGDAFGTDQTFHPVLEYFQPCRALRAVVRCFCHFILTKLINRKQTNKPALAPTSNNEESPFLFSTPVSRRIVRYSVLLRV